mmetsp:Transcript_6985/g.25752  ORF Transcript_6985/g.25752 Transcript_6985/m.25752 type:complete len:208 (+) Transcript_6985:475-1098(+)
MLLLDASNSQRVWQTRESSGFVAFLGRLFGVHCRFLPSVLRGDKRWERGVRVLVPGVQEGWVLGFCYLLYQLCHLQHQLPRLCHPAPLHNSEGPPGWRRCFHFRARVHGCRRHSGSQEWLACQKAVGNCRLVARAAQLHWWPPVPRWGHLTQLRGSAEGQWVLVHCWLPLHTVPGRVCTLLGFFLSHARSLEEGAVRPGLRAQAEHT